MTSLQSPSSPTSDITPSDVTARDVTASGDTAAASWKIKLLYDGECPLCLREVNFLQRKDAGRGLVTFVDIADPNYSATENGGVSFEDAMGRIHAVLADDTVVKNVAVFRQVYTALGIGWLYAPTKWPVVGWLVDKVYDFWADRRLAWTGRPPLDELVAQRQIWQQAGTSVGCDADDEKAGRCRLD